MTRSMKSRLNGQALWQRRVRRLVYEITALNASEGFCVAFAKNILYVRRSRYTAELRRQKIAASSLTNSTQHMLQHTWE